MLEFDKKIIDKIEALTITDFGFDENNKIEAENCVSIIEELIWQYEKLQTEFDDYMEYVNDNFVFKEMR